MAPSHPYQRLDAPDQTSSTHRKPLITPCQLISLLFTLLFLMLVIFQAQILSVFAKIHFGQCSCAQPTRTETFHEREELMKFGEEGDKAWRALLPANKEPDMWEGVIFVALNETYRLPYGVSYLHALHCLGAVRKTLLYGDSGRLQHNVDKQHHVGHCLSYVAQHVLCSADDTIERASPPKDAAGNYIHQADGIEGKGEIHRCRDRSKTEEILGKLRAMETLKYPGKKGEADTLDALYEECPECFGE
ncbi:uncharacterized protein BDZ99DRAFT_461773 [Mytilinidion resinicola]|uniref:Uncharacterized protein n=1 Tax=Mytilinidion resinicola TaxID=574789 RepID=A0A6A6YUY9_9PEZI|nr:uncharacterized protein BDZ99DRAFT_461773 [Mytilinidion resinicola]KAF2811785.1 hypothetical protein BDZ99DRAFT_461773 [Mytilinidion resinicola]